MEQSESKIRKILFNEVTAAVALVGLTVGIVSWIKSPDAEMATKMALMEQRLTAIEENHLPHIENVLNSLEEKTETMDKNIVKILTILNK